MVNNRNNMSLNGRGQPYDPVLKNTKNNLKIMNLNFCYLKLR